jgi:hypothetical protein
MKYKNIFEYLDHVLAHNPNPTKEDISLAKQQYYKEWHLHYNRKRRATRKEFTLGFNPKTLKQIDTKKGTRSVSKYLYDVIYCSLADNNLVHFDQELLVKIHQKLMQVLTTLEELLDNGTSADVEPLLERIEALELEFRRL